MITRCSSRTRTLKFGSWVTSSRPHSHMRQRGHKTMGHVDTWSTLKHSTPVCPLNGFLGQFTHCKFSPVPLSLINQHWSLETKAYKVEPTWIQSLVLFCKHAIWSVYIEHTQRKGGNQQDRTKACWYTGWFSLWSDGVPNILGRAKNNLMLFIYRIILCTHTYNFLLLRSIKNNVGMFLKPCIQGLYRHALYFCYLISLCHFRDEYHQNIKLGNLNSFIFYCNHKS